MSRSRSSALLIGAPSAGTDRYRAVPDPPAAGRSRRALVGAALAAAGASYQTLFRNPLVSPDILGVSAGAGFGAVLGILLSLPVLAIQGLGFGTGLATVAIVYRRWPARCAARTRSWCWCWPASSSARWPAPASRW